MNHSTVTIIAGPGSIVASNLNHSIVYISGDRLLIQISNISVSIIPV